MSTSVVASGDTRTVLEEEGLISRFEDDPAATIAELQGIEEVLRILELHAAN